MSDFQLYFEIGLRHVLDINGYDHMLFLIVLTVPYAFRDWKKVLLLVTLFTIGHTLSLIVSVFGSLPLDTIVIEFLIPITILLTALYNIFTSAKKSSASKPAGMNFIAITTLCFGIIHGLGFSNYFKVLLPIDSSDKLLPLLEFALGIETAQIIVVMAVLILTFIVQDMLRLQRRDWILVTSSFVAGVAVTMIAGSEIW
jgi:hypothetical protein